MIEDHRLALEADARRVLEENGRTFAWATRALGARDGARIAILYAFCRRLDDLVDDKPEDEARAALTSVRSDFASGTSQDVLVGRFLELADECGIEMSIPEQLLLGFESDLRLVRMRDEAALIRYAYRVAGTVGLMSCRVLDVRDTAADRYAIDLGIGMQLTNIARDVLEDASRDRVYLPRPWLSRDITPATLERSRLRTRLETRVAINRLLSLASDYYRSGDAGMGFLPTRARLSVLTASRAYEGIGAVLAGQRDKQWRERAIVDRAGKLRHTARALGTWLGTCARGTPTRASDHDPHLHRAIRGLPGADGRA